MGAEACSAVCTHLVTATDITKQWTAQRKHIVSASRTIGCSGSNVFEDLPYYRSVTILSTCCLTDTALPRTSFNLLHGADTICSGTFTSRMLSSMASSRYCGRSFFGCQDKLAQLERQRHTSSFPMRSRRSCPVDSAQLFSSLQAAFLERSRT